MSLCLYTVRFVPFLTAPASRMLSMMHAWFSSSETIRSPASQKVGNTASVAVQHDTKV